MQPIDMIMINTETIAMVVTWYTFCKNASFETEALVQGLFF